MPHSSLARKVRYLPISIAALQFLIKTGFATVPQLTEPAGPLDALAAWVAKTGVQTVIREPVAKALDLSESDVVVRERGFRHPGETLTHVCALTGATGTKGVLILATVNEVDGSSLVWRTSSSGLLEGTAFFSAGRVNRIPDSEARDQFLMEKRYFITKQQEESSVGASQPSSKDVKRLAPFFGASLYSGDRATVPLRAERWVIATHPWVMWVIIGALALGTLPIVRR